MNDNLRDQIAAALMYRDPRGRRVFAWSEPRIEASDLMLDGLLDAVLEVVQAAITEARRAGWDEGQRACCRSCPVLNPYTPAGEPDIPLAPSGRKVQRRQSIPPTQNPVTPMVVGADGRGVLADDCACGHTRNWHVNPKYECDVSGCLCATFTKPVKLPPPAQQPAGPDARAERSSVGQDSNVFESAVDTAAIRAEWLRQCGSCDADLPMACSCVKGDHRPVIDRLCDALDARDAEIRELRAAGKSAMDLFGATVIERDDARARLDEIRALCDERDGCVTEHTRFLIREIRLVLDR